MNGRYKLEGKVAVPVDDLIEWARWYETADRHVGRTAVGPFCVSTVDARTHALGLVRGALN